MNTYFSVTWPQHSKVDVNFECFLFAASRESNSIPQCLDTIVLYLPFQSVHSPLQVPTEYTEKYENITDDDRKIYAGMVENVDEAIGNITEAMKTAGLVDNK